MNHSLVTADRTTHLKIVVLSLIFGVGIVVAGIGAHLREGPGASSTVAPPVVKADKPAVFSGHQTTAIR